MINVAIIGAGQLGSRHLQGLAKSQLKINIEVVEPFEQSREMAKNRFDEIPHNENIQKICFYDGIDKLSSTLDLVIVATNSDVRYEVVSKLLSEKYVNNLVLEKVLFQRIDDYYKIEELLKKTKTNCWVNHPRRMFPFYKKLKEQLTGASKINFSISGGNWGLGCNGLHFLDCIQYLVDNQSIILDGRYLEKKLYETKRKGFLEFNGMLLGHINNSHLVEINSFENHVTPVQFNITSDIFNISIDETNGYYNIKDKNNNWLLETKEEKIIYFQSELTHILLEDILNDQCLLPKYSESMLLHIKYLELLISHTNKFSINKYNFCPIT